MDSSYSLRYTYQVDETGKKSICPKEPDATIIRKACKKIAANKQTTKSVYNQAVLSGLKCSIPNFGRILITILDELKKSYGCYRCGGASA